MSKDGEREQLMPTCNPCKTLITTIDERGMSESLQINDLETLWRTEA
jgi:hypothetical protein